MPRLILVADDLTGALDSAVAFAARGMETVVARGERGLKSVRHR
ncbi:four-carbon acid sugar kinase family protein [Mangrovicoccus ximenensis]|nr:four-carbon acid sugar kinase family protein [Mangrovicoccus ximenensis]